MAFSRTDNGIYCRGTASGDASEVIGSLTGSADVLLVTCYGYDASAATGDYTVDWGNGSSWESLTLASETLLGGQLVAVFRLIGPTTSYDRIRINLARTYTEGVSVTWVAYSAAGTVTVVDSGTAAASTYDQSLTDTLVGGASGDQIYVGGHDYTGDVGDPDFDLSVQSQTVIETEETTACNSQHYGHAEKDWSSGATIGFNGDYPALAGIALNDAAAGGATDPIPQRYYHLRHNNSH